MRDGTSFSGACVVGASSLGASSLGASLFAAGVLALAACGGGPPPPPIDGGFPVSSAAAYPNLLDSGVIDPKLVEVQLFNEYVPYSDICSATPTFSAGIEGYELFIYAPSSVNVGTYPFGLFLKDGGVNASQALMSELLPDGGAINTVGLGTVTVSLINTVKIVGSVDYQFIDDGGNTLKAINTTFTAPFCPDL